MKIHKKHTITKSEDTSIIPFLEFAYSGKKEVSFRAITEDTNKRPDYIVDTNVLIELKEIHDRASNQKHAQWGKIASRLQKAVDGNDLLSKVKGTFLVNTPDIFRSPTDEGSFIAASTQVLNAVIGNEKTIEVFKVKFEINKVSDQEHIVVFGSYGGGGSIDPSNTVYQNIKDKLASANKQLSNPPANTNPTKRIILLVNKYYFPLWNWDLFKAISRTYQDLLSYKNVDEIWYQFESKDQGFTHKLLYKRSFFEQFEKSEFQNLEDDDSKLFANWFSSLSEMGDTEKGKLLIALKYFLKDKKPYQVFPDNQTREEIVRFGLWLAEKEMFDEVIWFVEQFIDDPDPLDPEKIPDGEKFNYHQEIIDNKDSHTITTVLGHLSWVIQKLAMRKNFIVKALEFTNKLLEHKNLYIKLQALIPLIEISARRQWLEDYDKEKGTQMYEKFRTITFDLLDNYSQYKAIANWLAHVFHYFKDLSTNEALNVLEKLRNAQDAAVLFVYFGIFRERHYKGKVEFDPKPLKEKLEKTILQQDEELLDLKGSIAWNFWKILEETPQEFDTLKPYLDLFFDLPYSKRYYSSLERIIEQWIKQKPDICIPWFTVMMQKLRERVASDETTGRNTWIEPEETIKYIAENKPENLHTLVQELVELWKLGAFVGSPKTILESYKLIVDPALKNKTMIQFKSWYEEMKTMNPKIEIIIWEE